MARLLQLTDLHAVAREGRVSGRLDTAALLDRAVDALLARMDRLGPFDAALITGDVSDDGSPESYRVARAALDRLGLPLLVIPGNHDAREALRAGFADLPTMPARGPVHWVAEVAGSLVIGLDTLVEGQGGGRICAEGLALLETALARARGAADSVTVALHHPPLRTGIAFMDGIGLENPDDLAAALRRFEGPLRVVAGHVHGVYQGQLGGHPVCTAPSVCSAFALDRRADAPVGFFTEPLGFGVIEAAGAGLWSAQPLTFGSGPHGF